VSYGKVILHSSVRLYRSSDGTTFWQSVLLLTKKLSSKCFLKITEVGFSQTLHL
jgi:hypothetical protein